MAAKQTAARHVLKAACRPDMYRVVSRRRAANYLVMATAATMLDIAVIGVADGRSEIIASSAPGGTAVCQPHPPWHEDRRRLESNSISWRNHGYRYLLHHATKWPGARNHAMIGHHRRNGRHRRRWRP